MRVKINILYCPDWTYGLVIWYTLVLEWFLVQKLIESSHVVWKCLECRVLLHRHLTLLIFTRWHCNRISITMRLSCGRGHQPVTASIVVLVMLSVDRQATVLFKFCTVTCKSTFMTTVILFFWWFLVLTALVTLRSVIVLLNFFFTSLYLSSSDNGFDVRC